MGDVAISQGSLNNVEARLSQIEREMNAQLGIMNQVGDDVQSMRQELSQLKSDFETMINEQKRTAAIQQATTELVRIRQELEQEFGNYRVVRETMLGVLQATDSALVRENTISRVSEELMLSTPKYWLAPVLVAVSAWISNDRDLAERAIKEAIRRDEERTALTMALICRRNKTVDTCYEWLSIYFSKQKAYNFTSSNFNIVNAYINNVFGPDEKHLCDEYMGRWVNEIKGNSSNFEQEQEQIWRDFCDRYTVDIDADYPDMKDHVREYSNIKGYISRINSVDVIGDDFQRIHDAYVDEERLKEDVDSNLIDLISKYDKDEEQLRKEERLQQAIKDNNGNKDAAIEQLTREDTAIYEKSVNLIEQMTRVIAEGSDCKPSEKKTAISFLGGYIKKGFHKYITENKESFPSDITIQVDGWEGRTQFDPSRIENKYHEQELVYQYTQMMENERRERLNLASKDKSTAFLIGGIVLAVLAIFGLVAVLPIGIILGVLAVICFVRIPISKKNMQQNIYNINMEYDRKIEEGQARIRRVVYQWNEARNKVISFNDEPIREIIA